ncbi:hypothetical protein [Caulobacter sp. NIBR2454]|uniref:hypothetical protein n=1 Tax=Caulobacter sp. NIBR2454 TaxID=3015996 RepID=UPI0022B69337|nr:hypothetical protein [Caulobacter sp. NIBR2454]
MHFMIQLLNSLDELIFRVMSWLLFYPLTLWRTLRSPAAMMTYAERELTYTEDKRYDDAVSPPLFLFLSVLVSHAIELALVGDSPMIANRHGLSAVVDDDSSLLMLRVIFFGLFPLVMAVILLRRRGIKLMQQSLKGPFYAQCYVAAPYALAVSLSASLLQTHRTWILLAGLALLAIALVWYVAVQALWFARELKITALRGLTTALLGTAAALAIFIVAGALFR